MRVATGTYVGTGADGEAVTVGFQADYIHVKCTGQTGCQRTSTMVGDASFFSNSGILTDGIQSITSTGFTVGTRLHVNGNGTTYYYTAIQADTTPDFKVGSYTGNGLDNRAITGVGFQPAVVQVLEASAGVGVPSYATAQQSADAAQDYDTGGGANLIQSLDADGFTIGSAATINTDTAAYHYIAFKAVDGFTATGTYVGNGADDRDITAAGFQPAFVHIHSGAGVTVARIKTADMGLDAGSYGAAAFATDAIQSFTATGFQVGTHATVNGSGVTLRWFALKAGVSPAGGGGGSTGGGGKKGGGKKGGGKGATPSAPPSSPSGSFRATWSTSRKDWS